jgi:GTP-binding protein
MDLEFIEWLTRKAVPFVLVFTKTDTVKPATVQKNIQAFIDCISGWFEKLPAIFTCSSTAKHGRRELLGEIERTIAETPAESGTPPEDDVIPPEDSPTPGRKVSARNTQGKRPNPARPW